MLVNSTNADYLVVQLFLERKMNSIITENSSTKVKILNKNFNVPTVRTQQEPKLSLLGKLHIVTYQFTKYKYRCFGWTTAINHQSVWLDDVNMFFYLFKPK